MALSVTSLLISHGDATIAQLNSTWNSLSPSNAAPSNSSSSPQSIPTFALSITLSLLLLAFGILKRWSCQARQRRNPILPLYSIPESRVFSRRESTPPMAIMRRFTDPYLHSQDPRIRTTVPQGHEFISLEVGFGETQTAHKVIGRFTQRAIRTVQDTIDVVQDVDQDIGTLGNF